MLLYIWIAAIVAAVYLYCRQVYSRFNKYGVKHMKPVPLLGNMAPILFRTQHFIDNVNDLYKAFPEEKFVGNFEFINPVVYIRDIELIKKITVKDFEYFLDHRVFVSEEADPFFGRNLMSLKGQVWKDMRSTLSPAFTSSKMKHMLPFIVEVGDQMVVSLKKKVQESKTGYIDIETKELTTHYTNDVIATCAFGLKVDSHTDPSNEFYKMGHKASNFGFLALLKFIGYATFPFLMKLLKASLFPEDVKHFFKHLVLSTMQDREVHNILRPDMIHLLMEAKKGRLSHDDNSVNDTDAGFATVEESNVGKKAITRVWSDTDLIAQAVLFFIAGFETVSTAMAFLLYELALNPEVQEKLAQEIKEHEKMSGGKFDYNSIQTMTYMDMVVSELLRLWPPAVTTDRMCIKDYNLGRPNDKATQDFIISQTENYGGRRKVCFEEGDQVLVKHFYNNGTKHVWKKGCVKKCIGNRLFLVHIIDLNLLVKKHVDQLVLYKGSQSLNITSFCDNTDNAAVSEVGITINESLSPNQETVRLPVIEGQDSEPSLPNIRNELVEPNPGVSPAPAVSPAAPAAQAQDDEFMDCEVEGTESNLDPATSTDRRTIRPTRNPNPVYK